MVVSEILAPRRGSHVTESVTLTVNAKSSLLLSVNHLEYKYDFKSSYSASFWGVPNG